MRELEIGAELQNMETVRSYVTEQLEEAGFGPKQIMEVELAVEEIFCNIANYAYKPEKGNVLIRCEVEETDKCRITIEFIDQGVPYNPLERSNPDITLEAEERDIGGLGIFLSKAMTDSMDYRYEDGKNILVITKERADETKSEAKRS